MSALTIKSGDAVFKVFEDLTYTELRVTKVRKSTFDYEDDDFSYEAEIKSLDNYEGGIESVYLSDGSALKCIKSQLEKSAKSLKERIAYVDAEIKKCENKGKLSLAEQRAAKLSLDRKKYSVAREEIEKVARELSPNMFMDISYISKALIADGKKIAHSDFFIIQSSHEYFSKLDALVEKHGMKVVEEVFKGKIVIFRYNPGEMPAQDTTLRKVLATREYTEKIIAPYLELEHEMLLKPSISGDYSFGPYTIWIKE